MSHLLGVRYNIKDGQDISPLINILKKWLKDIDVHITRSTGGEHAEASSLHIHYHLLIDKKLPFKAGPLQTFKNHNPDFHLGKRQLSITYSLENEEKNVERFLQYPLKEDKPIDTLCYNNKDLDKMIKFAQAEYEAAKVWLEKKKKEQDKKKAKKASLFAYLDSKSPKTLYQACKLSLEYYLEDDDCPHPQQQIKNAETWAYKRGIWSKDDIICRYTHIKYTETDDYLEEEIQKHLGNI